MIGNALAGATTVGEAADDVSEGKRGGVTVVFESDGDDDDDDDDWKSWLFGKSKRVCWVSASSAARIDAIYRTEWITIGNRQVLVVYNAKKKQLRRLLDGQRHCRLVRVRRAFFLPFDPHVS